MGPLCGKELLEAIGVSNPHTAATQPHVVFAFSRRQFVLTA